MDEQYPRRWTATITYADDWRDLCYVPARNAETVPADESTEDLQRSQLAAAKLEASMYLLAGCAKAANVQLYKTTKAHGTVKGWVSEMLDVEDAMHIAMRQLNRRSYQR